MANDTEDKLANARSQAMAQYASISEMVAKLKASRDDEAFEEMAKELATEAGFTVSSDTTEDGGEVFFWHKRDELAKYNEDKHSPHDDEDEAWTDCAKENDLRPDEDEARREIEEDALSVEVRSGWYTPGGDSDPEEFRILLCTGGPAVQIRGELNEYKEPTRAYMQCQDWFTPWTDVFGDGDKMIDSDVLLEYAQTFYFGE
jgi:hypothetical protein